MGNQNYLSTFLRLSLAYNSSEFSNNGGKRKTGSTTCRFDDPNNLYRKSSSLDIDIHSN